MKVWKFWCEWDIGYNDSVFSSENLCRKYVRQALKDCGIEESMEECEGAGYLGFGTVNVIDI